MGVVALRNQIARADIQKKAGEQRERQAESVAAHGEQARRRDPQGRCRGIQQQPAHGTGSGAVILQHHVHGIDAVRKIVGHHRDRHRDADGARGLECQPDGDSVQQAVAAQQPCGHAAARRGRADAVNHRASGPQQIRQKAERGPGEDHAGTVKLEAEIHGFGQKIEESDADDRSGAESEYQMQFVAKLEREQPAEQSAHERAGGDAYQ